MPNLKKGFLGLCPETLPVQYQIARQDPNNPDVFRVIFTSEEKTVRNVTFNTIVKPLAEISAGNQDQPFRINFVSKNTQLGFI